MGPESAEGNVFGGSNSELSTPTMKQASIQGMIVHEQGRQSTDEKSTTSTEYPAINEIKSIGQNENVNVNAEKLKKTELLRNVPMTVEEQESKTSHGQNDEHSMEAINSKKSSVSNKSPGESSNKVGMKKKKKDKRIIDNKQQITKPNRHSRNFNKSALVKLLNEYFPIRNNLGTIVYNPTTTWETLQFEKLIGLKPEDLNKFRELRNNFLNKVADEDFKHNIKYISVIPQLPIQYSNSLLEIKIPNRFIKQYFYSKEDYEDIPSERKLWGGIGGIYSDDSDIISVLLHMGLFNGQIDLSEWNSSWKKEDIIAPLEFPEGELDLSVTILLLPPIESYHGFYANGINSRSWVDRQQHRGLSYVVYNVKWETCGAYLRDKHLTKDVLAEECEDIKQSKKWVKERQGWKFDRKCYEQLKAKYQETNDKVNV